MKNNSAMRWVRADDGALFGVCKGLAEALNLGVGAVRLMWLALTLFFFGSGLWIYLFLVLTLPKRSQQFEALKPKFLGVCRRVALKTDMEVGLVRFLALNLMILSFGAAVVGYLVLHFLLPDLGEAQSA